MWQKFVISLNLIILENARGEEVARTKVSLHRVKELIIYLKFKVIIS